MLEWFKAKNLQLFKKLRMEKGAVIETVALDGSTTTLDLTAIATAEIAYIDGLTAGTPAATKAVTTDANVGVGAFRMKAGLYLFKQAAPAAKTVSVTLTAAELIGGIITGNQGAAGAAAYTLPLGTDLEAALIALFPGIQVDDAFDVCFVNLSVVGAEDITVTTNAGWTLVGNMIVTESAAATPGNSNGLFRVRRTAASTFTIYRVA